jgi:hypothetical protein
VKDEKSPQKLGRAEGSTGRKARLPEWLPEEVWALSMLAYVLDRIGSERNIWDLGDDVGSRLQDIQQSTLDLMLASMPELGVEPFELKVTDALYLAVCFYSSYSMDYMRANMIFTDETGCLRPSAQALHTRCRPHPKAHQEHEDACRRGRSIRYESHHEDGRSVLGRAGHQYGTSGVLVCPYTV